MKNFFFVLFSMILLGFGQQAIAQTTPAGSGMGAPSMAPIPVKVSLKASKTAVATVVTSDALMGKSHKGLKFQLLDANGKAVKGGEKRVKYNEKDGSLTADIVGLLAPPRGKYYKLRITSSDKTVTDIDLK